MMIIIIIKTKLFNTFSQSSCCHAICAFLSHTYNKLLVFAAATHNINAQSSTLMMMKQASKQANDKQYLLKKHLMSSPCLRLMHYAKTRTTGNPLYFRHMKCFSLSFLLSAMLLLLLPRVIIILCRNIYLRLIL